MILFKMLSRGSARSVKRKLTHDNVFIIDIVLIVILDKSGLIIVCPVYESRFRLHIQYIVYAWKDFVNTNAVHSRGGYFVT